MSKSKKKKVQQSKKLSAMIDAYLKIIRDLRETETIRFQPYHRIKTTSRGKKGILKVSGYEAIGPAILTLSSGAIEPSEKVIAKGQQIIRQIKKRKKKGKKGNKYYTKHYTIYYLLQR